MVFLGRSGTTLSLNSGTNQFDDPDGLVLRLEHFHLDTSYQGTDSGFGDILEMFQNQAV